MDPRKKWEQTEKEGKGRETKNDLEEAKRRYKRQPNERSARAYA